MLKVSKAKTFLKSISKIKDIALKEKLKKQIRKIILQPEIGKPMRYDRKGTRELYVKPFRISYAYRSNEIIFLDMYHKDDQ
ncbi:MAG: type II toxin-antitoxin system RelE/ParE family toxin [Candidatus Woesearchaeota archaeon]